MQRLLDQQAAETGAIDEQIAFDALAAFHHYCVDMTIAVAQHGLFDLAFSALDAARLGVAAQPGRV